MQCIAIPMSIEVGYSFILYLYEYIFFICNGYIFIVIKNLGKLSNFYFFFLGFFRSPNIYIKRRMKNRETEITKKKVHLRTHRITIGTYLLCKYF